MIFAGNPTNSPDVNDAENVIASITDDKGNNALHLAVMRDKNNEGNFDYYYIAKLLVQEIKGIANIPNKAGVTAVKLEKSSRMADFLDNLERKPFVPPKKMLHAFEPQVAEPQPEDKLKKTEAPSAAALPPEPKEGPKKK